MKYLAIANTRLMGSLVYERDVLAARVRGSGGVADEASAIVSSRGTSRGGRHAGAERES